MSANGTRQLDRWPTPVKFASKVLIMYKSIYCTYILFSRFIFFHSISVLNELVTQFLEASKNCSAIQVNYLNHCSVGHPYIYIYIYIVWEYGSKLLTSNVIGGMGPNRRIKVGTRIHGHTSTGQSLAHQVTSYFLNIIKLTLFQRPLCFDICIQYIYIYIHTSSLLTCSFLFRALARLQPPAGLIETAKEREI